jgi:VWFA-related protein
MFHSRALTFVLLLLTTALPAWSQRTGGGSRGTGRSASGPRVVPNPTYQNTPFMTSPTVQHASDERPVEFRSETILVQVPVVVTDKAGNAVPGLSRTDFEVLEDGKEQKISSFEEVETSHAPLTPAATQVGEYSNAGAVGDAPRAVTIIALDTINTPYLDQTYGRKQLLKYLADNVQPGQAIGLVSFTSRGVKVIHDLSSDPAELMQALKKVNGELPALQGVSIDTQAAAATGADLPSPSIFGSPQTSTALNLEDFVSTGDATIARMQQDRAIEATIKAFLELAWSVRGVPGKKSLVWATGGFPFFMDTPSAVPGGYLSILYERALQAMNDSEISVYPVDVRGLVNFSPTSDASQRGARLGNSYTRSLTARSWLQSSTIDSLKDFAEMTGGRAFYNSNDLTTSFKRAADDASHYYVLSYYLDTRSNKPGWRKLKVKLHRPGTEVRARSGFFVTNATVNPDTAHQSDMAFALTSPFDSTGIPLTVRWRATSADGDKKKVQFGLHVAPQGLTFEGERNAMNLDFAIIALTAKSGTAADTISQTVQGAAKPESLPKLRTEGIAYNNALELPPGHYTVRFVVRDNPSGRIGSVSAPLTVN